MLDTQNKNRGILLWLILVVVIGEVIYQIVSSILRWAEIVSIPITFSQLILNLIFSITLLFVAYGIWKWKKWAAVVFILGHTFYWIFNLIHNQTPIITMVLMLTIFVGFYYFSFYKSWSSFD